MSQTPSTDPASAPDTLDQLTGQEGGSPSTGLAEEGGGSSSTGAKAFAAAAGAVEVRSEEGGGTPAGG
jgi:hypothetical protein